MSLKIFQTGVGFGTAFKLQKEREREREKRRGTSLTRPIFYYLNFVLAGYTQSNFSSADT